MTVRWWYLLTRVEAMPLVAGFGARCAGYGLCVWLLRLPGVYRPQADTWLLAKALREAGIRPGAKVLDLGAGCGALAVEAAAAGAGDVTAVDRSRRAVLCAAVNAGIRGLPVRTLRGDLLEQREQGPFDVVLANPPYVPCAADMDVETTAQRAWNAGIDGRKFLDPLCANAASLLTRGGSLLMVHSALCGTARTLSGLRRSGLKAAVVARAMEPFGPVLRERAGYLAERGLISPGENYEELVVIRADRVERPW